MTSFALSRRTITAVFITALLLAGLNAYFTLPQDEDPGFVIRTATVVTYFPGASPERIEELVTDRIEEVVQEIPELDFVQSQSRTGVSIIYVNIAQEFSDMRPIWDNLRRKVQRAGPDLPDGVIGPFVDDEFGDVFGILFSLVGEGYTFAELEDVADEIRDELLRLPDVAKVEIFGVQDQRVFVEYSDARLAEVGISTSQLSDILRANNIIIPGGDVHVGRERIVLEPSGNFESVEDLRRVVIQLPGRPEVLYLEDLATIRRGYIDPPSAIYHANGTPGLAIGVSLEEGGNVLALGEQVDAAVRRLQTLYPHGIELERVADQPGRVERKVDEFVTSLFQAMGLVLVVMLFSLGLRTGLVVSTLIPAAMLATLTIMSFIGEGLNQMSLAALIIALGMLIDNAIVMSESIIVNAEGGMSLRDAAIAAGRELRVPLLTSSLTTAAAFLPIYLAKSTAGEYTGVIFVVVAITLLCSWVLALTMTPLLCVKFLKVKRREQTATYDSRFYRVYRSLLTALLRRRWLTLVGTFVLFFGVMQLFPLVPYIFFPRADRTFFTAQLRLPPGTDIATTESMVGEIEAFMEAELLAGEEREGITRWASFVGGGEPRYILTMIPEEPDASYAFMLVNTSNYPVVFEMIDALEGFIEARFPDAIATILPTELGPPVVKPIQIRISGYDNESIFAVVDEIKTKLASLDGPRNVDDDWGWRTKKLEVAVNQPRARRAGVTSLDVATSLQASLTGIETTQFREGTELIPVVLRTRAADRQDPDKLETLNVYSQTTGQAVPLKQVADVRVVWEPSRVFRRDRLKTVTVECDLAPGVTPTEVNAQMIPWLDEEQTRWRRGIFYELGGEIETSGESSASIGAAAPIAFLAIVLLLVAQFNSVRRPIIVLTTIPLGLIGVVLGLLLFRSYFGFMTLLGVVSLAGIVINNAIVLLDRIRIEIEENGRTPQEAIIEAGQRRMRPILLTTMTTIGGLIPLYLGGGPMWEPMAVAIMAGLAFATVLTLGVVPVLYAILFRVRFDRA